MEKRILRIVLGVMILLGSGSSFAQQTEIYQDRYKVFKDGLELYDKHQYQAAQRKFFETIQQIDNQQDEVQIDAEYYAALCALELFNKDAEHLLNKFVYDHPDNVRTKTVYFQLGTHHYRRKRYRDALKYFEEVDPLDLSKEDRIAYHFKYGYAAFYIKKYKEAKEHFYEVKDLESEYKVPATYYYSHLAYMDGNYQVALEGFRSIDSDPNFSAIVPYYIAQILYKQNKFDGLIEYGPKHYASISEQRKPEYARLIGDAYYKQKDYKSAVPYLETYNKGAKSSRADNYQMGYAYYTTGDFEKAIVYLSKVKSKKDKLAQVAFYQLADCYIRTDQKEYARNAFKAASQMEFDQEIEQEALWSYAKLAYELSYNPYDEAIEAFHAYIEKYPNSKRVDDAYEYLLNVYTTTKNYDAALQSIDRIKNKNSKLKKAYQQISYNRGVERFHDKNYSGAIEDFVKVKKYPVDKILNAGSIYWIGESNFALRRFPEAITQYTAFKNEPGSILTGFRPMADYNLGYAYLRKENYTSSITAFRNYLKAANNNDLARKSDAYLRLADNYFLMGEDNNAIMHYENAIDLGTDQADYAYMQKAQAYEYLKETDNRINSLRDLVTGYPNSVYYVMALYQLGDAHLKNEQYDQALKYFQKIRSNHVQHSTSRKALYNIGVIYFRTAQYRKAEDVLNQVVDDYPNAEETRESAVSYMKEVYIAQDKLNQYADWLRSKGINPSDTDLDNDYYLQAMAEVDTDEKDCHRIIEKFQDYLQQIQQPKHAITAHYYIATCSHQLERYEDAVASYNKVIAASNNEYSERALFYASEVNYYQLKDYQAALSNLTTLEKVAQEAEYYNWSLVGQMHTFFKLENYQFAKEYARKVLNKILDKDNLTVEAQFIEAISLKELMQYSAAILSLRKVTEITKSRKGAEAKYSIAEILYLQERYEEAEKEVQELVQQKPGYDYWLAKGIILLGDIYMATGDYFNARYSLESVMNGYKGDDDLVSLAQAKLARLDELENESTGPDRGNDPEEIDLNGDKNNTEGGNNE